MIDTEKLNTIRLANDTLRRTFFGNVVTTPGFAALHPQMSLRIVAAIKSYSKFGGNLEHDRGRVTIAGTTVCFQIVAYDPTMNYLSEDASNPKLTRRVMTLFLPEED